MAIVSFRSRALRRLFEDEDVRGVSGSIARRVGNVLFALHQASRIDELERYPGWRLHPLKGDLRGFWSISVSGNWRIVFRFERGMAYDVDLVDYH